MRLYVALWPDNSVTLVFASTLEDAYRELDAFGDVAALKLRSCGRPASIAIDSHEFSESLYEAVLRGDEDRDSLAERVTKAFIRNNGGDA